MPKALLTASTLILTALVFPAAAMAQREYSVTRTLKLGGEGGWDYVTVDPQNKLLYLPRPTHTMIVHEDDGSVVADIQGTKRAHGVALVPQVGRGFISDGEDACVVIFDLKSNAVLGKVPTA